MSRDTGPLDVAGRIVRGRGPCLTARHASLAARSRAQATIGWRQGLGILFDDFVAARRAQPPAGRLMPEG